MIYQHRNVLSATNTIITFLGLDYVSILLVVLYQEWLIIKSYVYHVIFYRFLNLSLSIVYAYVKMDTLSTRIKMDVARFAEME